MADDGAFVEEIEIRHGDVERHDHIAMDDITRPHRDQARVEIDRGVDQIGIGQTRHCRVLRGNALSQMRLAQRDGGISGHSAGQYVLIAIVHPSEQQRGADLRA
jgi:hypothetical protein